MAGIRKAEIASRVSMFLPIHGVDITKPWFYPKAAGNYSGKDRLRMLSIGFLRKFCVPFCDRLLQHNPSEVRMPKNIEQLPRFRKWYTGSSKSVIMLK